jgi:dihydroorotase
VASDYDLLLRGGTVLDPASGRHGRFDVGIRDGRIAAIEPQLSPDGADRVVYARGRYVTPGLIDFHVHSYWGVNEFGLDVDPLCQESGVTTAVDAGSAGPANFVGYERFVAAGAGTRLLGFVALARYGILASTAELSDLRFADPDGAARTVQEHPERAVGIKLRLDRSMVGDNGREALRLAILAGEASGTPVMVHIGYTGLSIEEIADTLRPGDVITHCFTPLAPSIVDEQGRVRPAVRAAQERGVILDVGHAGRHFPFEIARACIAQGLPPQIISTDIHGKMRPEAMLDLPTALSKLLAVGMSLEQVIAACTINPARAIGWDDRIGRLEVGGVADIAVLELVDGPTTLRDCVGGELTAPRWLRACQTIRAGQVVGGANATER